MAAASIAPAVRFRTKQRGDGKTDTANCGALWWRMTENRTKSDQGVSPAAAARAAALDAWRARRGPCQTPYRPNSAVPADRLDPLPIGNLFDRSCRSLVPWDEHPSDPRRHFRGFGRAIMALLGVSAHSVGNWRRGGRRPSIENLHRIRRALSDRVAYDTGLIAELDAELAAREREPRAWLPMMAGHRRWRAGDAP